MTKRLFAGVLLVAVVVLMTSLAANAERPSPREWQSRGITDPMINHDLPMFFRSAAGTTWVRVHPSGGSPCSPADTANSPDGQTIEHVWCFEGGGGDSTWPWPGTDNPDPNGGNGWTHWSKFNPPLPPVSKWHITTFRNGGAQGSWNAWAGCDTIIGGGRGNNDLACQDVAPFWTNKEGYGDDWNYALELSVPGGNTTSGGTIEFDIRYDVECLYDYLYLEYLNNGSGLWEAVVDTAGNDAAFNAISGNTPTGSARDCGDIYGFSDQNSAGNPNYGTSAWLENVTFPLPAQTGGLFLRWRAFSDGAWSDADGSGDTEGMGAVDNVSVVWNGGAATVSDNFESADLNGIVATGNGVGAAWAFGGLEGNSYDGWHLEFSPTYKNKGNTCTFSDDWMWAAKPATGAIPENGFSYYLVSPVISTTTGGPLWTNAILEYSGYLCMVDGRQDYTNTHVRQYKGGAWSLWTDFDGFITFAGCEFWNFNNTEDLTPYLDAQTDSLQLAWEVLDVSSPGTFDWGKHGSSQFLVDNVSVGYYGGDVSVFTARVIDIFADTFSKSDPSHTPFLQNPEQGEWTGTGGARNFSGPDSLSVNVADADGITEGNVILWWRSDLSTGPVDSLQSWEGWQSKAMDLGDPEPTSLSDEGTYRAIIGNDLGGIEDYTSASDAQIWLGGETVQYYVTAMDDFGTTSYFPAAAGTAEPTYFEFSVLPFGEQTISEGHKILVVDDFTRNMLDFENSSGFNPTGGIGYGAFLTPVFDQPEDMIERALAKLYIGGSVDGELNPSWDKYDVQGGGSSVQCEPRGVSRSTKKIAGYMNDFGAPQYDALIWMQGSFANYSFADTTRLELGTYLDNGGNLLACGDDVADFLGAGGSNADSTISFLQNYFGTAFLANDGQTDDRVLNVVGRTGTSMAGYEFGIYGECPIRRAFDRLTLATPAAGSVNSVLMDYSSTSANDDKPAVIKNRRTAGGGTAVLAGFDISAFVNDDTRACFINAVFENDFNFPGTATPMSINLDAPCLNNGVDVPVLNPGVGFRLAAASPNPFASSTAIQFSVASRTHVSIEVYNILGQKVRTLVNENLDADSYVREWDGRTDNGANVSSGIYFYKMVAGDFSDTKKAVLLK